MHAEHHTSQYTLHNMYILANPNPNANADAKADAKADANANSDTCSNPDPNPNPNPNFNPNPNPTQPQPQPQRPNCSAIAFEDGDDAAQIAPNLVHSGMKRHIPYNDSIQCRVQLQEQIGHGAKAFNVK